MENKPGQLARISELMGEAGVNILAFFVSTATKGGQGLIRFVGDNPDKARQVLKSQNMPFEVNEVIAAETPHHAGGLLAVLNPLRHALINVSYIYPCIQTGDATILIIGVESQQKKAIDALKKDWIRLYGEELYKM
jgi:hypothetical protein